MSDCTETICFTCGMPTGQAEGEFPRLNTLPSGASCPTCRDRLLESLPPLLPADEPAGEASEEDLELEAQDSDGLPTSVYWGHRSPDSEPDEPA